MGTHVRKSEAGCVVSEGRVMYGVYVAFHKLVIAIYTLNAHPGAHNGKMSTACVFYASPPTSVWWLSWRDQRWRRVVAELEKATAAVENAHPVVIAAAAAVEPNAQEAKNGKIIAEAKKKAWKKAAAAVAAVAFQRGMVGV